MYRLALAIFVVIGAVLFGLGLLYLTLDEFMPYHADALQTRWQDLQPNYQGFILGALKALGGGALVAGFATLYMAVMLLRSTTDAYAVLLPLIPTGYSSLLAYATYTVYTRTPGSPPLLLTVLLAAMALIGSVLFVISNGGVRSRVDGR